MESWIHSELQKRTIVSVGSIILQSGGIVCKGKTTVISNRSSDDFLLSFNCIFTDRKGRCLSGAYQALISHSVHNRPHGHSVTAHPCYGMVGTDPTGMLSC